MVRDFIQEVFKILIKNVLKFFIAAELFVNNYKMPQNIYFRLQ